MSKPTVRIVFTGSRDYGHDGEQEFRILSSLHLDKPESFRDVEIEVAHGGARGFDCAMDAALRKEGWRPKIFRPDYQNYSGKKAPLIRNREMLEWAVGGGRYGIVVAMLPVPTPPHSGTLFTLNHAIRLGAETHIYRFQPNATL